MPKSNNLTFKQRKFTQEYISNGFNATQAALKSYNTNSYNTAASIANENLNKPNIKLALTQELEELSPEVRAKLNPDWIISKIQEIALSSRQDSNKLKALELLGETKYQKLFEKHSVVENITNPKSEQDLDQEYRDLLKSRDIAKSKGGESGENSLV